MEENTIIWNNYPITGDAKELDIIVKSEVEINLDYNDIIATLSIDGNNYVSSGIATSLSGAFKSALDKLPTMLNKAKRLLIQFICGNRPIEMAELSAVTEKLNEVSSEISLLWGIASDFSLNDEFKVIILLSE